MIFRQQPSTKNTFTAAQTSTIVNASKKKTLAMDHQSLPTKQHNTVPNAPDPHGLAYVEEDLIDLVDVAAGIYARRWLFLGAWAAVAMLGLVYALIRPQMYAFTTTIEIGSRLVANRMVPVEAAPDVVLKLEKRYIPAASKAAKSIDPEQPPLPEIKVSNKRNSNLVTLSVHAPENQAVAATNLEQTVVDDIVRDHARLIAVIRANLAFKLQRATLALVALQDPATLEAVLKPLQGNLLKARAGLAKLNDSDARSAAATTLEAALQIEKNKRLALDDNLARSTAKHKLLDHREQALKDRAQQIARHLSDTYAQRERAVMDAGNSNDAMTLMLIDGQIQRREDLLSKIQDDLTVELPDQRSAMQNKIDDLLRRKDVSEKRVQQAQVAYARFATEWNDSIQQQENLIESLQQRLLKTQNDNQRNIDDKKAEIVQIQARIDHVRATRSVLPPQQSARAAGRSTRLLLALSVFAGLVVALLTVGFAAFIEKLRTRLDRTQ